MALLDATLALMQAEYQKPEVVWRAAPLSPKDRAFLEKECKLTVGFDPKGWRKEMYDRYKRGEARAEIRECAFGHVVVIYDNETQEVPWGIWGRILRLYHKPKSVKPRIYFLAHPALREFPEHASRVPFYRITASYPIGGNPLYEEIGPLHVNGGYNYPCNVEAVMIYRAEDATRVLIHELQHASCLDSVPERPAILSRESRETEPTPERPSILSRVPRETDNHSSHNHLDAVEAETEAWAELLYAGVLSQGKRATFHRLVHDQAQWMAAQNARVRQFIGESHRFPWRYTVAKEDVWRRWGIAEKGRVRTAPSQLTQHSLRTVSPQHSLQLTPPPTAALKRVFGVSADSTIL